MLFHQVFYCPVFRQTANVCHIQTIFVHADLDWNTGLVLFVTNCIQQCFTQSFFRDKVTLNSLYTLIADFSTHILQINHFQSLVHLLQDRSMDLILIQQVCVVFKIPELDKSAELVFFRVLCKKEHGGIRQIVSISQVQLLQKHFFRFFQQAGFYSAFIRRKCFEPLHDAIIDVTDFKRRQGKIIPCDAAFTH